MREPEYEVKIPKFIYITGADGTGKSTLTRQVEEIFRELGIHAIHPRPRSPFFFSLPLLAYARLRGFSRSEVAEGTRHGYWDFQQSWLMREAFPWVLLADAALAALFRVYIPLRQVRTIVCERFALDMLVDLETGGCGNDLHKRLPGKLYLGLIPKDVLMVMLELDEATIRERRPDLRANRDLEWRLSAYRRLARDLQLPILSSQASLEENTLAILKLAFG